MVLVSSLCFSKVRKIKFSWKKGSHGTSALYDEKVFDQGFLFFWWLCSIRVVSAKFKWSEVQCPGTAWPTLTQCLHKIYRRQNFNGFKAEQDMAAATLQSVMAIYMSYSRHSMQTNICKLAHIQITDRSGLLSSWKGNEKQRDLSSQQLLSVIMIVKRDTRSTRSEQARVRSQKTSSWKARQTWLVEMKPDLWPGLNGWLMTVSESG